MLVGDLLCKEVPTLASGELRIVAIARRPGVLSKVAVQRVKRAVNSTRPVALVVGLGGAFVRRVSDALDGERIDVVQWHRDPRVYVPAALGLTQTPNMWVSPISRLANVRLGDVDYTGVRGWRATNLLLASALTGWRIRLRRLAVLRH